MIPDRNSNEMPRRGKAIFGRDLARLVRRLRIVPGSEGLVVLSGRDGHTISLDMAAIVGLLGQLGVIVPRPPATGHYVLTSTDGTLAWEPVVDCAGEPA